MWSWSFVKEQRLETIKATPIIKHFFNYVVNLYYTNPNFPTLKSQKTLKFSHLKNMVFLFFILLRPLLIIHTQSFDVAGQVIIT